MYLYILLIIVIIYLSINIYEPLQCNITINNPPLANPYDTTIFDKKKDEYKKELTKYFNGLKMCVDPLKK